MLGWSEKGQLVTVLQSASAVVEVGKSSSSVRKILLTICEYPKRSTGGCTRRSNREEKVQLFRSLFKVASPACASQFIDTIKAWITPLALLYYCTQYRGQALVAVIFRPILNNPENTCSRRVSLQLTS